GYRVNRVVFPPELKAVVHTSDGRVLDQAFESDTLIIYPGERFSVLAEVLDTAASYVSVDYLDPYRLKHLGRDYIPLNDVDFEFIPYSETDNDPDSIGVGEAFVHRSELSLYPNPFSGHLTLSVNNDYVENVRVFDLQGREVLTIETNQQRTQQINTSGLPNGIHILRIKLASGEVRYEKVLKIR
ncbi:MAG: T9SS type A sorting domain-containing protein, partial [Salibacteraceae bacterium]